MLKATSLAWIFSCKFLQIYIGGGITIVILNCFKESLASVPVQRLPTNHYGHWLAIEHEEFLCSATKIFISGSQKTIAHGRSGT